MKQKITKYVAHTATGNSLDIFQMEMTLCLYMDYFQLKLDIFQNYAYIQSAYPSSYLIYTSHQTYAKDNNAGRYVSRIR